MESDLLYFLKTHKIFSSLDESIISELLPKFTRVELDHNSILFHQGEAADYVYILTSGKLIAQLNTGNNQHRTIGHIDEGDIVGELGALANTTYPYSIKAIRNSVLYKLTSKEFIELCHQKPSLMLATIHPVISVAQNIIHLLTQEDNNTHVVIVPANKNISLDEFAEQYIPLIQASPSTVLISDFLPEYNNSMTNSSILVEKIRNITIKIRSTQKIFYLLRSSETELAKIALKKADTLYIVANSTSQPEIDSFILDNIQHDKTLFKSQPNLILLHAKNVTKPIHTSLWLYHYPFNLHHHVRMGTKSHFKRLLRFMRGKAVGLVLSGGGTRGWAHLGAMKSIRDQKIPIDFIGGTSVGAIIGGCYSLEESYENAYEYFYQIVNTSRYSVSVRSMTLPLVSIFDAKNFTNVLYNVFDNTLIEDLWLPFFCVTCNLANYSEEIHRTGLLWEKARASASIPGLIPPAVINGEIHFDGGLLNNLPVDVMWQMLGKKGKTIAVELTSSMHDTHKYHFPPVLTFKQALMTRLGMNQETYKFPRFVDSFMRGLLIGSSAKAKHNGQSATILVNLSLRKFRILQFNQKHAEKMFEIGYLETTSQILQYKNRHWV